MMTSNFWTWLFLHKDAFIYKAEKEVLKRESKTYNKECNTKIIRLDDEIKKLPREKQIVRLLCKGLSAPKISETLAICIETVYYHFKRLRVKHKCEDATFKEFKLLIIATYKDKESL